MDGGRAVLDDAEGGKGDAAGGGGEEEQGHGGDDARADKQGGLQGGEFGEDEFAAALDVKQVGGGEGEHQEGFEHQPGQGAEWGGFAYEAVDAEAEGQENGDPGDLSGGDGEPEYAAHGEDEGGALAAVEFFAEHQPPQQDVEQG